MNLFHWLVVGMAAGLIFFSCGYAAGCYWKRKQLTFSAYENSAMREIMLREEARANDATQRCAAAELEMARSSRCETCNKHWSNGGLCDGTMKLGGPCNYYEWRGPCPENQAAAQPETEEPADD